MPSPSELLERRTKHLCLQCGDRPSLWNGHGYDDLCEFCARQQQHSQRRHSVKREQAAGLAHLDRLFGAVERAITVTLTNQEYATLMLADTDKQHRGGFAELIRWLQDEINPATRQITLEPYDLERLDRYVHYDNGGWERQLRAIFGRTLGQRWASK